MAKITIKELKFLIDDLPDTMEINFVDDSYYRYPDGVFEISTDGDYLFMSMSPYSEEDGVLWGGLKGIKQ